MLGNMWWVFLAVIIGSGLIAYIYLNKLRKIIGYHLGMNIAMTTSGVYGLAIGAVLGAQYHQSSSVVTIATTLLAVLIGVLFGSLIDYQTLVAGVTSGIMSGLMGPMLGMHSNDPMLIAVFCTILVPVSSFMLCYSVKS
ncbi:hypothetical protein [Paenibacillus sp. IHBB 10380]|uniref:hypothetical protein n=1 Tax=Paenibacillus sp. IHBB 10380 TaxID=1566358 RepID=UPI0005CFD6F5|nr:hypothetical protein [Paenibacillus sp. IHBB 10380]AJS58834.1 hypothetical protein UB51_10500 [Paenibacillus sp. IHBB 10380]